MNVIYNFVNEVLLYYIKDNNNINNKYYIKNMSNNEFNFVK